jgi:hypothetical protein
MWVSSISMSERRSISHPVRMPLHSCGNLRVQTRNGPRSSQTNETHSSHEHLMNTPFECRTQLVSKEYFKKRHCVQKQAFLLSCNVVAISMF